MKDSNLSIPPDQIESKIGVGLRDEKTFFPISGLFIAPMDDPARTDDIDAIADREGGQAAEEDK